MIEMHHNVERVYWPKQPCPRDLGLFYCKECLDEWLESLQGEPYDSLNPAGCGKKVVGMICGGTHLGYERCVECVKAGRDIQGEARMHHGEYESAVVCGEWQDA